MNGAWKKQVQKQMELEELIVRHTTDAMKRIAAVMLMVFAGLMAIVPFNNWEWDFSPIVTAGFLILFEMGVAFYFKGNLFILENGRNVNVFTKYRMVPVDLKLLVAAKTTCIRNLCLKCTIIYQTINLIVRCAVYIPGGQWSWNLWILWPSVIVWLVFLLEYVQIHYAARQI